MIHSVTQYFVTCSYCGKEEPLPGGNWLPAGWSGSAVDESSLHFCFDCRHHAAKFEDVRAASRPSVPEQERTYVCVAHGATRGTAPCCEASAGHYVESRPSVGGRE